MASGNVAEHIQCFSNGLKIKLTELYNESKDPAKHVSITNDISFTLMT